MINHIKGDLFTTKAPVISHCVNCQGAFASGVAGQIRAKHPHVYLAYMEKHRTQGWHLGDTQSVYIDSDRYIVNLAGQKYCGYDGKRYVSYVALYKCFVELFDWMENQSLNHLAIPRLGAGLAGGDFNVIEGILKKCLGSRQITVDVYSLE